MSPTSPPANECRFNCWNSALGSYWTRNSFDGSAGALVHIVKSRYRFPSCRSTSRLGGTFPRLDPQILAANFDGHLVLGEKTIGRFQTFGTAWTTDFSLARRWQLGLSHWSPRRGSLASVRHPKSQSTETTCRREPPCRAHCHCFSEPSCPETIVDNQIDASCALSARLGAGHHATTRGRED